MHGSEAAAKGGDKPGHMGHCQTFFALHLVREFPPESCACGNSKFSLISPYYPHQVIELPPVAMGIIHWVLHQGWYLACDC